MKLLERIHHVIHLLMLFGFLFPQVSRSQESGPPTPLTSPTDQAGYWEAIEGIGDDQPAEPVGFRDLWELADEYRGRRVRVEGRVERRFRQGPAQGQPALTESWVFSPAMDPLCLVYPEPEEESPPPGSGVRFEGTFLGHVRYDGSDVPRLAPLIAGSAPPSLLSGPPSEGAPRPVVDTFTPLGWVVGGIAAGMVVMLLLRQMMNRPFRRRNDLGPTPRFVDGSDLDQASTIMDGDAPLRLEIPLEPTDDRQDS